MTMPKRISLILKIKMFVRIENMFSQIKESYLCSRKVR